MELLKKLHWERRECSHLGRGDRRVSWIVHGEKHSVEFWIQVLEPASLSGFDRGVYKGEVCWPGGFEVHSRQGDGDPSHTGCQILGGACWHDGSSLSASEFFEAWGQSDEEALLECARWLRDREPSA